MVVSKPILVISLKPKPRLIKSIEFVKEAEHVGVLRSSEGNLPNLLLRFSAFKKAIGSLVSCGLARRQRSNPVASIRILSLYGTPVLLSGLASLVLSSKEISFIDQQHKRTVQALLKLSTNSPASLVHFIGGSLPGTALLHLRQLSLFGMICHLNKDPLNTLARETFLNCFPTSWFAQIRNLLLQYSLPHPLLLLDNPLPKNRFRKLVKAKVTDFWVKKLRNEASLLPSLNYFNPEFMSLLSPHMLLISAGNKTYEVAKARVQLLFLANQYPCNASTRHWSPINSNGFCTFSPCPEANIKETREHILLECPAYHIIRVMMLLGTKSPAAHQVISRIGTSVRHSSGRRSGVAVRAVDCWQSRSGH